MQVNIALKNAILNSGLKQYFVASMAQIDQTRFSKIIHGHVEPSENEMEQIAKSMGIAKDELFNISGED